MSVAVALLSTLSACTSAGARTYVAGAAAAQPRLSWAPPALRSPTRIVVSDAASILRLDDTRDYVLDMRSQVLHTRVVVSGGRNVVIIGGQFDMPADRPAQAALYIRRQPAGAVVHVEGVRFSGKVADAIDLEQPNATTVQIENVRVDGLYADDEKNWTHHPDLIQTWSGPGVLRVDRLTGYSPYQGIFLEPDDDFWGGPHNIPSLVDLRNVNIGIRADRPRMMSRPLWQSTPFPLRLTNVYAAQGTAPAAQVCWPNCNAWKGMTLGAPPTGDFVPPSIAGRSYVSPGYATQ